MIFREILSTTRDEEFAKAFAFNALFIITIDFKDNDYKFVRKARNAVYIEAITEVKGEEEIIFPSGTESEIISVKEKVYKSF